MTEAGQNPYTAEGSSKSDAEAAASEIRHWLRPLPTERLVTLLAELYLKTGRRNETDADREALFRVYARDLQTYPGDVVQDAIRGYRGKYFPAFDELRQSVESDRRIFERRQRLRAIVDFLDGRQSRREKPKGPSITPEFIDKMKEKYKFSHDENEPAPLKDWQIEALKRVDDEHGESAINKKHPGRFKNVDVHQALEAVRRNHP